jgi:hypothetical protein
MRMPTKHEWEILSLEARTLFASGLVPPELNDLDKVMVVVLKGWELSIPATYAVTNILIQRGRATCSAELMLSLIYRDHGNKAMCLVESSTERCTFEYRRNGNEPQRYSFTMDDARTAGLGTKGTWLTYPMALLRARCISAIARFAFPDSIGGMYTPEELGFEVQVTDDGTVEAAPTAPPPANSTVTQEQVNTFEQVRNEANDLGFVNSKNEQAKSLPTNCTVDTYNKRIDVLRVYIADVKAAKASPMEQEPVDDGASDDDAAAIAAAEADADEPETAPTSKPEPAPANV